MNSSTHLVVAIPRGVLTTVGATGIGLVLGILYVWSVVKAGIPDTWGWSNADKALPYSIMAIAFSVAMVPAGRLQDRVGPRLIIMIGGFLTGLGCIISGLGGDALIAYVIGFGIITGTGVGFGYCALTPTAVKWFSPEKTGLIVGIVVSGNGLAPVFLAPISALSLNLFQTTTATGVVEKGVSATMITLGIGIWLVVGTLVWLIRTPPLGFSPVTESPEMTRETRPGRSMDWRQMIATLQFWLMFFMFFAGASTGLIFISVATDLGKKTLGVWAFLAVIVLSFGNTGGRLLAGVISDKIGRMTTLLVEFICQGLIVGLLFWLTKTGGGSWPIVLFVVFMIGLNYGSNHTLFPSACKDYYGIHNFGLNYGLLFSAFGTAGLIMPWLNGLLQDITGEPDVSYIMIICMMAVSALLALVGLRIGPPRTRNRIE
jgi:OFA family oxalate/formate antiporter-like MFS transporter